MTEVVTIDGDRLGTLLGYRPGVLYIRKRRYLKSYYVNDPKYVQKLVNNLWELVEEDFDHRKLLLAVVQYHDFPFMLHPDHPAFLNDHNPNPDVYILMYDKEGNPVPLEALVSDSMTERSQIAKLHRFYLAQRKAFDKVVRQLDNYRQYAHLLQDLLAHRDAEVEMLMNANRELASIVNSLEAEIVNLRYQVVDLERKLRLIASSAENWHELANEALNKTVPALMNSLNKMAEMASTELTRTMRSHVRDLERESLLASAINEMLERIKRTNEEILKLAHSESKKEEKGGGSSGGEEGGEEGEGA